MPNKTDRIVSYLPSTFKKRPRGQTLHAVVDAFGRELQDGENSLAAVMQSHWVDYADRLEQQINDLGSIAALYGLAPRPDETVEAFREHLKRYVRAYLDGTVTVQGILRIAAQALELTIADDYQDLDTWWARPGGAAVAVREPDGRDAAEAVLGVRAAFHRGLSARAAQVRGTADLSLKVDCRENNMLSLEMDGAGPFEIDVAAGAEDRAAVPGQLIADNVNAEIEEPIASFDGRFLTLTSPRRTSGSVIQVHDILNDTAEAVLGLPPRAYYGRDETPARVRGLVDLSGVLDLSEAHFLRLLIDGQRLAEIDVAGPNPAHSLLHQVVEKMNEVLGPETVTHDGRFLTLTSPTTGLGSSIVFQQAAAQQALLRLFGPISRTHVGRATRSAQVIGRRDLSGGLDLSQRSRIRLRVDGAAQVEIECAGQVPANSQLPEVVAAINEATNMQLASHNGRNVILTSPSSGLASEILFLTPDEDDATELIFGIRPRLFRGRAATAGRVIGTPDLSQPPADLRARYLLHLRIDGRPPLTVDLRSHIGENGDVGAVTLRQLADAIDDAVGADVATTDGQHLILVSASEGSGSSVEVVPLATTRRARFVTRAIVTGEAADAVFGFTRQTAVGTDALNARVRGTVDVHRGVDLRQNRYLRLLIDDHDPVEFDCAGDRPRATLIDEMVDNINFNVAQAVTPAVASGVLAAHDSRHLVLTSPITGQASRIALEPARAAGALDLLLGIDPGEIRGQDAEKARFVGTADLSQGVDLSAGDQVKIGLDGAEPVAIACAANAADPASVQLNQIKNNINRALGRKVASHDGHFLQITSRRVGGGSQIVFAEPETGDATQAIFGITAPAEYHGRDATAAQVVGTVDLSDGVDLSQDRNLRLVLDDHPPLEIDCVGAQPRATRLDEIVNKINRHVALALAPRVAGHNGRRLILSSPTLGRASRIAFAPPRTADALPLLLGVDPGEYRGHNAEQVRFVGTVDLSQGVDLSAGDQIKIGLNGADAVEIACADGADDPVSVQLDQIKDNINARLGPNIVTHDDHYLQITSPTVGAGSQLLFAKPATGDATQAIFGIDAPREYHGRDAAPAEVVGKVDLGNGVDRAFLQIIRYLRLGVDNRSPQDVDTLRPGIVQEGEDPRFVTLAEIVAAINDALDANVASHDGHVLTLRSPTTGQAGRLVIEPHSSGDARRPLFGDVPDVTSGADPTPATIVGQADLLAPADLSRRSIIRLAVDDGLPVEIDIAGFAPGATLLEEIAEAINATFPSVAPATPVAGEMPERRLRLTSLTTGSGSRLELLPLRTIDLIEYPAFSTPAANQVVRHNGAWFVDNRGAAAGTAEALITAPLGVAGPALVNETLGWQVRLLTIIAPGETARIWAGGGRLRAEIRPPSGEPRRVPGRQMLVGPLGAQAWVPFEGAWHLSGDGGPPPALQLNNPLADQVVWLHARQSVVPGQAVGVTVVDSDISPATLDPLAADGQWITLTGRLQVAGEPSVYRLVDRDGNALAVLRDGAGLDLGDYLDRVVVVGGTIHADEGEPLLIARQVDTLFTVTLTFAPAGGDSVTEVYERVTIGQDPAAGNALVRQVYERPSSLVRAQSLPKITVLSLALGRSRWRYLDCYAPRFNYANFNGATFPGAGCNERGVFDVSRFANRPPEPLAAVFTSVNDPPDPPVEIRFNTVRYRAGAFRVHLPADLPENFGGRFNLSRFGQGANNPELYLQVVTEPPGDPRHVTKVFDRSPLVRVSMATRVPLGWEAFAIPFRQPRHLTLGDGRTNAAIYLTEPGRDGYLLIEARHPGAYGNQIAISTRPAGPAMYDFAVIYEGVPFENARETVLGKPLAILTQESLEPGPAGVLQAKAAGVHAVVSRERTPAINS